MNSQRLSLAAAAPSASRSWLSSRLIPIAVMKSVWIGSATPSTRDGVTSSAASLPTSATPRALNHGATEACSPAAFWPTAHGPTFARRAQRPVLERVVVVLGALGHRIVRERHRLARFHERHRLLALRRRDEIHRSELVVLAPASPVRHLMKQLIEFFGVARRARLALSRERRHRDGGRQRAHGDDSLVFHADTITDGVRLVKP